VLPRATTLIFFPENTIFRAVFYGFVDFQLRI
jgi:hypothetical protein